jgi:non-heme chloroperoxidase
MGRSIVVAFVIWLAATSAFAQASSARPLAAKPTARADISGQWQGMMGTLRLVLKVSKAADGYQAGLYTIDQNPTPFAVESLTLAGSTMKFTVPDVGGAYEGQLSADGQSLTGTFTQGSPTPLNMVRATPATAWVDASPHKVQFVTTNDHVRLEVLDWGGTGRPLVFLAGLGANAHVFDKFALQFTAKYHVYGISRRGYGGSDKPDPAIGASYTADRLGDDVLAVLDALKLDRPVLAAWSLGGEEMSSIVSRKPERVAGLIYLEAGNSYSFYTPGTIVSPDTNVAIDINDIRAKLMRANSASPSDSAAIINTLMAVDLPQLQADLAAVHKDITEFAPLRPPPSPNTLQARINDAILAGEQKYTALNAPILAIFASPRAMPPNPSKEEHAALAAYEGRNEAQVRRFEAGNPRAKVVRLANAQHAIFLSNPEDVAREMNAFMDGLK